MSASPPTSPSPLSSSMGTAPSADGAGAQPSFGKTLVRKLSRSFSLGNLRAAAARKRPSVKRTTEANAPPMPLARAHTVSTSSPAAAVDRAAEQHASSDVVMGNSIGLAVSTYDDDDEAEELDMIDMIDMYGGAGGARDSDDEAAASAALLEHASTASARPRPPIVRVDGTRDDVVFVDFYRAGTMTERVRKRHGLMPEPRIQKVKPDMAAMGAPRPFSVVTSKLSTFSPRPPLACVQSPNQSG